MPGIGSSPGIGSGAQVDVSKLRAQSASEGLTASSEDTTATGAAASEGTVVATSTLASTGQSPVDTDRVSTIRKAIQSGNYPVVPTKIGDAMIAAGLLLRGEK